MKNGNFEEHDWAVCRGQKVFVVRADPNGLRYLVRFQDGNTVAVRGVDLSAMAEGEAIPETVPAANPFAAMPPALVGLKTKITGFDPMKNFRELSEIMSVARQHDIVDFNEMARELGESGSTIFNWMKGTLRAPNAKAIAAVRYIDQRIAQAMLAERSRNREQLQAEIHNSTAKEVKPSDAAAKSIGSVDDAVTSIQILVVQGDSYSIKITQNPETDHLEAVCEALGLKAFADNRVDLMIDMKGLIMGLGTIPEAAKVTEESKSEATPEPEKHSDLSSCSTCGAKLADDYDKVIGLCVEHQKEQRAGKTESINHEVSATLKPVRKSKRDRLAEGFVNDLKEANKSVVEERPRPAAEKTLDNLLQQDPKSLEDAKALISKIGALVEASK